MKTPRKPDPTAPSPGVHRVAKIIAKRDSMPMDEALELVLDCCASIRAVANDESLGAYSALEECTDILASDLGLEPDYLDDLLFEQI